MVGQLPGIITKNNKTISDYFNQFYDSDNDTIIKPINNLSLYKDGNNNKSYVKSYAGEFKNLTVDNLILNSNINFNNKLSHLQLSNCFLYNDGTNISEVPDVSKTNYTGYAHNSGSIAVDINGEDKIYSLTEIINTIKSDVDTLKKKFSGNTTTTSNDSNVEVYGSSLEEPNSFTFDKSLLFASPVQLKRMKLPQYQYNDLKDKFIYTYYYGESSVVTINDDNTASIQGIPGSIITLKFKDNNKKGFYRVLLSRQENKYLRISKDDLNRIKLLCLSNNEQYGSTWEVESYSVRSKEDLVIEKK